MNSNWMLFFNLIDAKFNLLSWEICWKKIMTEATASINHWIKECDKYFFFLYALYCNKYQNFIPLYFVWMSTSSNTKSRANAWWSKWTTKSKPTIKLGKIIGVNPNLYKTIDQLFNLLRQLKSDEKTWIRIGFDGVPYQIKRLFFAMVVKRSLT